MKYWFWSFLIFISGANAMANLARMVPTNQSWEPSWLKFSLACLFAILFSRLAKEEI